MTSVIQDSISKFRLIQAVSSRAWTVVSDQTNTKPTDLTMAELDRLGYGAAGGILRVVLSLIPPKDLMKEQLRKNGTHPAKVRKRGGLLIPTASTPSTADDPVRQAHQDFQQGRMLSYMTSEAHQSVMYSMKNDFVGFILSHRRNCPRYSPIAMRWFATHGLSVCNLDAMQRWPNRMYMFRRWFLHMKIVLEERRNLVPSLWGGRNPLVLQ